MCLGCLSHNSPPPPRHQVPAPVQPLPGTWDVGVLCPPPAHLGVVPPIGGDSRSPQGLLLLKKSLGK